MVIGREVLYKKRLACVNPYVNLAYVGLINYFPINFQFFFSTQLLEFTLRTYTFLSISIQLREEGR